MVRSPVAFAIIACAIAAAGTARATETTVESCVRFSEEGQAAREQGELLRAHRAFAACAAATCPSALRSDCARWLDDVDRDTPTVVAGVKDARGDDVGDARVTIDGKSAGPVDGRAVPLDPGSHLFRFEREGATPAERTVIVRTGERNRLIVETLATASAPAPSAPAHPWSAPPPADTKPIPTSAYVVGGIGVASLVTFVVLGGLGVSEKSTLRGTCSPACTDAQVAPLKGLYIGADVSLAAGVVLAAVAGYLALTGR